MHRKILLITVFMFALLLAIPANANAARPNCKELPIPQRIKALAGMILSKEKEKTIRPCYDSLSEQGKALVFEEMAAQRGLLNSLRQESENNQPLTSNNAPSAITASWQQLIERVPFSAIGKTLRSVTNAFPDQYCDGSDPDMDYIFVVRFPYAMTNPDALRSFAGVTAVDAMLTWYQVRYGGINGRGTTTSGYVYLCIGDTGVSMAGGVQAIRNALRLHDNN